MKIPKTKNCSLNKDNINILNKNIFDEDKGTLFVIIVPPRPKMNTNKVYPIVLPKKENNTSNCNPLNPENKLVWAKGMNQTPMKETNNKLKDIKK